VLGRQSVDGPAGRSLITYRKHVAGAAGEHHGRYSRYGKNRE
jgi:hypothetical protein